MTTYQKVCVICFCLFAGLGTLNLISLPWWRALLAAICFILAGIILCVFGEKNPYETDSDNNKDG